MELFITGTDTDVGKTFITAGLAASFASAGAKVGVYKPAQTGATRPNYSEDLEYVKKHVPNIITKASYILPTPASPMVSADVELVKVSIDKNIIKKDFEGMKNMCDITLVEGSGGLMVPFAEDFLAGDIPKMLNIPIVIVTRATLGTINHTLLSVEYAKKKGLKISAIVINNYPEGTKDIAIKTAPMIIQKLSGVDYVPIVAKNKNPFGMGGIEIVKSSINTDRLFDKK